jgi:hypothetical protein
MMLFRTPDGWAECGGIYWKRFIGFWYVFVVIQHVVGLIVSLRSRKMTWSLRFVISQVKIPNGSLDWNSVQED